MDDSTVSGLKESPWSLDVVAASICLMSFCSRISAIGRVTVDIEALISQKLVELVDDNGDVTPEVRLQAYASARGFETGGSLRLWRSCVTPDMVREFRKPNRHQRLVDHAEVKLMFHCNMSV